MLNTAQLPKRHKAVLNSLPLTSPNMHSLPEPEHVPMMWSSFAQRVEDKYGKPIMSCRCFHTGTTHTVRKSTIRTTISGNRALVMMDDREQYFIAISKGIGCDAMKVFGPSFLGWI